MPEKINTSESNEILKILVQAISDAYGINRNIKDDPIRKEINKFLEAFEEKAVKFFRDNIDRRKEVREKSLLEDMANIYKIKGNRWI